MLIQKCADLDPITTFGRLTPLQIAVDKLQTPCVRLLVENQCDVNLPVSFLFNSFQNKKIDQWFILIAGCGWKHAVAQRRHSNERHGRVR